eukprot:2181403-Pyramimonas_sp.AAC.1
MLGSDLHRLRSRLATVRGASKLGRCTTTTLDLRVPGPDPATKLGRECLAEWLKLWTTDSSIRDSVHKAWPS